MTLRYPSLLVLHENCAFQSMNYLHHHKIKIECQPPNGGATGQGISNGFLLFLWLDAAPLTPDGNLTVVDDYQTTFSDGTAQQFITLVSKSGAYFYLIIDRAADGDQTAHFLNMVDEADLLALMDEEDLPEPEPEPAPAPEPEAMPEPEPEEDDGAGKFVLALLVLAGIAGGGAYFWLKMREKQREAEENKPDPDADYREDEEEIVLPDEPDVGADVEDDEDAARRAYQTSDGYGE